MIGQALHLNSRLLERRRLRGVAHNRLRWRNGKLRSVG